MAKNLACTRAGRNMGRAGRQRFFFEKKNQKTFLTLGQWLFGAVRRDFDADSRPTPSTTFLGPFAVKKSWMAAFAAMTETIRGSKPPPIGVQQIAGHGMLPMPAQRLLTRIKRSFLVLFFKKEPLSSPPAATLRKTARRWI